MTESTITFEQQQAIADHLAKIPYLAKGIGTREKPCSVAAINLALTGELTDKIPECMSEVLGRWIIVIQDSAPLKSCRGNPRWRELLPLAAGTGRELEAERLQLVLNWMWGVLAQSAVVGAVPEAAEYAWAKMLEERTASAAQAAANTIFRASVAYRAFGVAYAAQAAALSVTRSTIVNDHASAANAAAGAAARTAADAARAARFTVWKKADPVGLLERLIEVGADDGRVTGD